MLALSHCVRNLIAKRGMYSPNLAMLKLLSSHWLRDLDEDTYPCKRSL